MRGSKLVALMALAGCNQVLGIEDGELDDVPAIAGTYLVGVDFRTNATLNTVVVLEGTVAYERDARTAELSLTPLTKTDHVNIGAPWVFSVAVTEGAQAGYSGDALAGDVPTEASGNDMRFAIAGSIAGLFKNESAFCGVLTGSFTLAGAEPAPLPSVTMGAVKNASPDGPVQVNCNGDEVGP